MRFVDPVKDDRAWHDDERGAMRGAVLFGRGGVEQVALDVFGHAVVTRLEDGEHVEREWCRKYFHQDTRPEYVDLLYRGRPWEWFRVEPGRWLSWDNSKIDLERLQAARE